MDAAPVAQDRQERPGRPMNVELDDELDDVYDVVDDTRYQFTDVLGAHYLRDGRQAFFLVRWPDSLIPADNPSPEALAAALRQLRNLRAESRASGRETPRGDNAAPAA
ncbi:hypothetical protein L917_21678 [Phytophthora nicotianae]|uniref:Uncharacterized protein n=1 Tax=Phytophthora nicotianae TaxID=4792 RepID=W2JWX9_PHYNI|nr:hypothetical protein L917_21678 [Phytophthora nicotianae]